MGTLIDRVHRELTEGLTVFALPSPLRLRSGRPHQRRLRTSNALERVNQEIKRRPFDRAQGTRTRVASLFPNEASLLRLACALLAEAPDDWEASKTYLDMNPSILPST